MKLGIVAGYSPATMSIPIDMIKEAEGLGFSSVWTAEAYGSDAVSPAAWILAQTEKIQVKGLGDDMDGDYLRIGTDGATQSGSTGRPHYARSTVDLYFEPACHPGGSWLFRRTPDVLVSGVIGARSTEMASGDGERGWRKEAPRRILSSRRSSRSGALARRRKRPGSLEAG